jgi:hypothetical protein
MHGCYLMFLLGHDVYYILILRLDLFAFRSPVQTSRLYEEEIDRESEVERTVLQMVESEQGSMLLPPAGGDYHYEKGKCVKPASWFSEQLPTIKDAIKLGNTAAAGAIFQELQGEAQAMVRYGVEALEKLSKTCTIPFAVLEQFLYDVCPTRAQPFIDNVSWK